MNRPTSGAMRRSVARTEEEYFEQVNELLATATPIGAYCLAFAEVFRRECGLFLPWEILAAFAGCATIAEGVGKFDEIREYQRGLPLWDGR
jgi:predicted pyridoxine 5'-phosphate oxidase superfamily flavin-nucleotide-binding protein